MALIRGVNCLFPCPRCMVSEAKQGDLSVREPPRTAIKTQVTIREARAKRLVGEREDILKAARLRDVDVSTLSFSSISFRAMLNSLLTERLLED